MPLTNTQKSLFNCINDIQKAHYEVYGSSDYIYKHKVGYYSAFIYFGVKSLNWNFLEKLKDITDKRSIYWCIKVCENGYLYIELNK